jgi:uncharacterized repeat protein (TIGR01451 family)
MVKQNLLRFVLVVGLIGGWGWGTAVSSQLQGAAGAVSAAILYVNAAAPSGGDGGSWADAFNDLQDALAATQPGDEIWVAAGVYKPTDNPADRFASFHLVNGVAVYGGFAAWETSRDQRDWETNVTVLSGDIDDNDLTDPTGVVTDTTNIVGANSYHVVVGSGVTGTAVLDGFTITAGQAVGDYPEPCGPACGGGLYFENSSPTLKNLIVRGNEAHFGGGMANVGSSPSLSNILFRDNRTVNLLIDGLGGGMGNFFNSAPILNGVIFIHNQAGIGGGMGNAEDGNPIVIDVTFAHNIATYGGGMANNYSSPTLINVTFKANSALGYPGSAGGGLDNWYSDPVLTNVVFSGNKATLGGGLANYDSSPTLTNLVFSGNYAEMAGGGVYNFDNSNPIIQNSLFWRNRDSGGTDTSYSTSIFNREPEEWYELESIPQIRNSLAPHCNPGGVWLTACGEDGGGNLPDADPLFIETPDPADAPTTAGNLRLQPGSPAIDAGNNDYIIGLLTDLDGNPRVMGAAVDLGPYEFGSCTAVGALCVNWAANGANDGGSWADAFTDLQDALAVAQPGDEIWVAAGVYKPTDNPTDREASFHLVNGVAVYGGFAAWETSRDQRDWETNITVLSGDIDDNDLTDPTGVVTDTANIVGANSYHVVVGSGVTVTAVLDGFTITAGQADGDLSHYQGGGMHNNQGSPTLNNLVFIGNYAYYGGGLFNFSSNPSLANSVFAGNAASTGGGMFNEDSAATLTQVVFGNNSAATLGGGMFNDRSSPTLAQIVFHDNNAIMHGGGMINYDSSSPILIEVVFVSNTATYFGGGMGNSDDSNPTLTSVTFSGNSATVGGGIDNWYSHPTLTNVTFNGNSATWGGGGMYNQYSSPTLINVTFNGNNAAGDPLGIIGQNSPALTTIFFCEADLPDPPPSGFGGAMLNSDNSSPILHDVLFGDNHAANFGGGMVNDYGSNPTLTDVVFHNNSAVYYGGGLINANSSPTLANVTFNENSAACGGGMANWVSAPALSHVVFDNNNASVGGGGMVEIESGSDLANVSFHNNSAGVYGGGLLNWQSAPTLTDVAFNSNEVSEGVGGGMYNYDSQPSVVNALFSGNAAFEAGGGMANQISDPVLTNVVFSGNSAMGGGGMANGGSAPILTNATFSGNYAFEAGGGMLNLADSAPIIRNAIFWHNQDQHGLGAAGASVHNELGTPLISYSLVQGCNPDGVWLTTCGVDGGGNLPDTDPLFIETPDPADAPTTAGNLRLQPGSPAIDAGNNDYVIGISTDLDGNPRIFGAAVDLGPYENQDATYTLTVIVAGQGTVTVDPDEASYAYGTMVTLTAVADPGWTFAGWSGDLGGLTNPESLIMSSHKTITATFSNNPPIAHAGLDQTVEVNQTVALDGGASYDDDPAQTLTYGWAQTGGPPVTLSNSAAVSPTFTAPAAGAILTLTLVVTDSYGLPSLPDSVTITVLQPQILITVTADKETATVGETITYSYLMTNSGDLPLSQVDPWDDLLGPLFATPINLTVGAAVSQTLTYVVSEADLPGPLANTVVVSGTTPLGNRAVSQDSTAVNLTSQPALAASLTVSTPSARPGETITYRLTLANSGDVTLSDLSSTVTIPGGFALPATLAPGEIVSVSYSYLVTAADLPGPLSNEVTITAAPPGGDAVSVTITVVTAVEPHRLFLPLLWRQ